MTYALAVIVALLVGGLAFWQIKAVITGYRKAIGTPWQRFLAAFSDSLTILWARVLAIVSAAAAFAINFLPTLDPQSSIGQAVQGVLDPKYVPWFALGVAVLFEVVRRRPGSIDPILPPPHVEDPQPTIVSASK